MPRKNAKKSAPATKPTKKAKSTLTPLRSINSSLMNYLSNHLEDIVTHKQIASKLGYNAHRERDLLQTSLDSLVASEGIAEVEPGKYKVTGLFITVTGRIDATKSGDAYLVVEGESKDAYIRQGNLKNAYHGDIVKARLIKNKNEAEVVEIIERKRDEFTGQIQNNGKVAFLIPDNKKIGFDIYIPERLLNDAKHGEKAMVKIVEWPENGKNPVGKVTRIFGQPGEHFAEMNAIIAEFGLPEEFPAQVLTESEAISEEIPAKEIEKRWDFRGVTTFTIDPVDAKDFDDAISFREVEPGQYEVGVHIADVTYYLEEGSALDVEALERGTSVYLVDRVIPMLPEKLSNHLCSLRPHEDKLCFSAVFVLDINGKILKEWFGRTVIHSNRRFSYEEAQEVIETKKGDYAEEIQILDKIAHKLRAKRYKNGSISFEVDEVKFVLDEKGNPLSVYKKVRKEAHKLIEDFMLLANRQVAEFVFNKNKKQKEKPFVYRVHDSPNTEKLDNLAKLAAQFGYVLSFKTDSEVAKSLNKLLLEVEGKPEQNMLQSIAIRTMSKAIYTSKKTGHYGLGFQFYTHFTSPIRRYPDVIAHRLLQHYITLNTDIDSEEIEDQCKKSSEMEVRAAEAERASIKYKQVQYMSTRVGVDFEGIISGVTSWGIYVEIIENKCEGMIRINTMKGDTYVIDEENFLVRGTRTGKIYRLGDKVIVKVVKTNLTERNIDMAFSDGLPSQTNVHENPSEHPSYIKEPIDILSTFESSIKDDFVPAKKRAKKK